MIPLSDPERHDGANSSRDDDRRARELEDIESLFLQALKQGENPELSAVVAAHAHLAPELERRLRMCLALHEPDLSPPLEERVPDASEPSISERIGRYLVLGRLGEGAASVVYRAADPVLARPVAIKLLRQVLPPDSDFAARFQREAHLVAKLRHANIVPVYDSGAHHGRPYLVMELVNGESLEDELRRLEGRPIDVRRTAGIMRKVAEALHFAHERGVVHRDVKPGNVLLDERREPQLADFGLALHGRGRDPTTPSARNPASIAALLGSGLPPSASPTTDEPSLTVTGQWLGTPSYMSPEQADGRPRDVDARSDVFSLGVVMYVMLTGRKPFDGTSAEVRHKILADAPARPMEIDRAVPADLQTICLKALEKRPENRYQSAQQMADELRRWQDDFPLAITPPGPWTRIVRWRRRNPLTALLMVVSAILLTLATGAGVWAYLTNRESSLVAASRDEAVQARDQAQAARAESTMQALSENGRARLRSLAPGRTNSIRYNLLPKLEEQRRDLPPGAEVDPFDVEMRSLAAAILAEVDVHFICDFRLRQSVPNLIWPVALHPSGKALAIGARDRPYRAALNESFELPTGAENNEPTPGIAYSPDGQWLAFAPASGGVELWDETLTERVAAWRPGDAPRIIAIGFAADSAAVRLCGFDGSLWTIPVPKLDLHGSASQVLAEWPEAPAVAAFSGDAERLAVGDSAGQVVIYSDGSITHRVRVGQLAVSALAWAPENERLAIGSKGGVVQVREVKRREGDVACQFLGASTQVDGLTWSPDGRWIVTGERGQMGGVWDAASGHLAVRNGCGMPHGFSEGGRLVSSGDQNVTICDLVVGAAIRSLAEHQAAVARVLWSADEGHIVTFDNRFEVHVADVESGRQTARIVIDAPENYALNAGLAIENGGRYLAIGYTKHGEGFFRIVDLDTGQHVESRPLPRGHDRVASLGGGRFRSVREEPYPNDKPTRFRTVVREYTLAGLAAGPATLRDGRPDDDRFFSHILTNDGRIYVWTGPRSPEADIRAEVWDVENRVPIMRREVPGSDAPGHHLSPGIMVAGGREWWHLDRIFDLTTKEVLQDAPWHTMAVSPDGSWFVEDATVEDTLGSRWQLRLRDRRQGGRVWLQFATRDGRTPPGETVAFSPRGRYLVWGTESGDVTLVDLPKLREEIDALETRYDTGGVRGGRAGDGDGDE